MNINRLKNDIYDAYNVEKQCMAAYKMRYIRNDPEIIEILFNACYQANNIRLQEESVRSLGVLKPEWALKSFIQSTKSYNNDETRRRGYYHLGTLGNPEATKNLLDGLKDRNSSIRRAALKSIEKIGNTHQALETLQQLKSDFYYRFLKKEIEQAITSVQSRITVSKNFNCNRSFNLNTSKKRKFKNRNKNKKAYVPLAF